MVKASLNFMYERHSWSSEPIYFVTDNSYRTPFQLLLNFKEKDDIDVDQANVKNQYPQYEVTILLVDRSKSSYFSTKYWGQLLCGRNRS